jgi:chorismate synthase
METIKEAADSLLSKGEITQDQHGSLEKVGLFGLDASKARIFARKFKGGLRRYGLPAAGVVTAGAIAKETIGEPIVQGIKIRNSFKALKEKTPQLNEKDDNDIKDYFNVIKTFSPKSASNPLVAGALVNKMMEFGGVDHKLVQDISAIEMGLARPSVTQTTAEAAAKAIVNPKD